MHHSVAHATWVFALLTIFSSMIISGCAREPQRGESLDGTTHEFDIHWPPIAPDAKTANTNPPLLRGDVSIKESSSSGQSRALEITFTIRRPSNEEEREFWNSQLAFSDVPWMDEVRVWDSEQKWQWPNLPYLLRRHGEERVERYGGIDPGKLVDNDFAAVLVRKFDADGKIESQDTVSTPLVSAEWLGTGEPDTDIHSLVHIAKSDTFVVHIGGSDEHANGRLKLWLIYADFLGSRPPSSWPKEREWAGGILAYCEIDWDKLSGEPCHGTVRFMTPPASTGFEWQKWSNDLSAPAQSRLRDVPK
ncbi:MAG: hypothetical protein R3C17_21975 [Planctomycetaceae bacterium]